jgi:hypothetical protein
VRFVACYCGAVKPATVGTQLQELLNFTNINHHSVSGILKIPFIALFDIIDSFETAQVNKILFATEAKKDAAISCLEDFAFCIRQV